MRWSTSILCLICGTAAAAETYRWVDKDGVVHYSDQPAPGAEKIDLPSAPNPGSVAPRNVPALPASGTRAPGPAASYTACTVTSPRPDEVLFNVHEASVALDLQPSGLAPGHRVKVSLNGAPVANWPAASSSFQLTNLGRGSFTVTAVVEDGTGRSLCRTPPSTFHIRQPSALSPGAQGALQRSGAGAPTVPSAAPRPARP